MDTVKRGYEPKDGLEFDPKSLGKLNAAAQELRYLLNQVYDMKSASTFVGNHHLLSERQRLTLARIISTDKALAERRRKELFQVPRELVLDGFNTIITLEVALSGSLLLAGMDGTIRALAELHPNVDSLLSHMENIVTSDAIILDQCKSWYNLNRQLIGSAIPDAWILQLDDLQKEGFLCQS